MKIHDIVQVTKPLHPFFPCLFVVDKIIGNWGVRAYAHVPGETGTRLLYARLANTDVEKVGEAPITADGAAEP